MDWKFLEEYKGRRGKCDIHEPKRSRRYFFIWRSVTRRESATAAAAAERSRRDIVYTAAAKSVEGQRSGGVEGGEGSAGIPDIRRLQNRKFLSRRRWKTLRRDVD